MTTLLLLSLAFQPHRAQVRGSRQAGKQVGCLTACQKLHSCPLSWRPQNAPSVTLRVVALSHPLTPRLLLTHPLHTVSQTDCDEWWARQLAGPVFLLSYFHLGSRNKICVMKKERRGISGRYGRGGWQQALKVLSHVETTLWETRHDCNTKKKLVTESILVRKKMERFLWCENAMGVEDRKIVWEWCI